MQTAVEDLLRNKRVKAEIERYKWLESERNGCDIGIDKASRDWLELYGSSWLRQHAAPEKKSSKRAKL